MAREVSQLVRLAAATLVGPPVALLVAVLPFMGDAILDLGTVLSELSLIMSLALPVAYSVMLILGLPAHMILVRARWSNVLAYIGVGGILGSSLAFAMSAVIDPELGDAVEEAALAGAACAGIFWLIRRPDRDAPPNPPTSPP